MSREGLAGTADQSSPSTEARRQRLNAAKLAALVASRWGRDGERASHPFGSGAALTGPDPDTDGATAAWVLPDASPERSLGPALLWAERQGADRVRVLAEDEVAGTLARQAAQFADPAPEVLRIDGTALAPAEPAPFPPRVPAPAPPELIDLLIDAGLEVVVEGGVVRGEINGLEVARIVAGQTTAGVPIDAPLLEVGVGKADRELTAMLHGELAPVDQLERVVEIVRRHRHADAPPHPLNQLVPERWLRATLCRDPGRIGLSDLRPAEGARPRPNLRDRDVAVATGTDPHGEPVVVVCSVGGALDLVPLAADARAAVDPDARLLLAVPERDDLAGNRRLAGRLRAPAEVVPVTGDWR
ncbi:MAG TPA: hypothetical protein VIL48_22160 [Acidimicrobiales bacterium]